MGPGRSKEIRRGSHQRRLLLLLLLLLLLPLLPPLLLLLQWSGPPALLPFGSRIHTEMLRVMNLSTGRRFKR